MYRSIKRRAFIVAYFSVLCALFVFPLFTSAATLGSSPSIKNANAGDTFSLTVDVSDITQPINAISGTLHFPKDSLRVNSISKSGTIINFWVQEPSFSNGKGTVSFEGVIMNPGYGAPRGKVLTISFTALQSATAELTLTDASVLANDGVGTNVISGPLTGQVIISPAPVKPVKTEPSKPAEPPKEEPVVLPPVTEPVTEIEENFVLTDYPRSVSPTKSFVISGKGGEVPVVVYGVKAGDPGILSSNILYTNLTSGGYDARVEGVKEGSHFQSTFKDLSAGRYAFYAKDDAGNISNIVFVQVESSFWTQVKNFSLRWWWIGLLAVLIAFLFYLFWHLGQLRAIRHQEYAAKSLSWRGVAYAKLVKKLDLGIVLTPGEQALLEKIRETYLK